MRIQSSGFLKFSDWQNAHDSRHKVVRQIQLALYCALGGCSSRKRRLRGSSAGSEGRYYRLGISSELHWPCLSEWRTSALSIALIETRKQKRNFLFMTRGWGDEHELCIVQFSSRHEFTPEFLQMKEMRVINASICQRRTGRVLCKTWGLGHQQSDRTAWSG